MSLSLNIAAPTVSVQAPSVSFGGNIGVNATAGVGIGGSASVSVVAPSMKIGASKITGGGMLAAFKDNLEATKAQMPGMTIAAPNVSIGASIGGASVSIAAPSMTIAAPNVSIGAGIGGIGGSASVSIATPSMKIGASKITGGGMLAAFKDNLEATKAQIPGMTIAAPNVSIGAGIGGASLSIAAPKVTMPNLNVKIATPSVSVKTFAQVWLTCEAGHPIRKYEAGASRGRHSEDRVCDHCRVAFKESQKTSYNCDHACDYDCCEECFAKRSAARAETSGSVRCTACNLF